MLNFRKTNAVNDDNYGKENSGKGKDDQSRYEMKVNEFLKYCKDFENSLKKRKKEDKLEKISDVRECFNESFNGYYKKSKRFGIFSRTTRVLNEMDKKLKKYEEVKLSSEEAKDKLREAFEYTLKRDGSKDKGSRAAVDDRVVWKFFDGELLDTIEELMGNTNQNSVNDEDLKAFAGRILGKLGKTLIIHGDKGLKEFCDKKKDTDCMKSFAECKELVLNGVTSINIERSFSGFKFTTVKARDIKGITGKLAFYDCTELKTINLPKATTIGNSAFSSCTALTTIELPKATTIGEFAFYGCTALTTINLPKATTIGKSAFHGCTALTKIELSKATSIGYRAFYGCTELTTINLPKATTIGNSAFDGCTNLQTVTLGQVSDIAIGSEAFSNTSAKLTINVPSESLRKKISKMYNNNENVTVVLVK